MPFPIMHLYLVSLRDHTNRFGFLFQHTNAMYTAYITMLVSPHRNHNRCFHLPPMRYIRARALTISNATTRLPWWNWICQSEQCCSLCKWQFREQQPMQIYQEYHWTWFGHVNQRARVTQLGLTFPMENVNLHFPTQALIPFLMPLNEIRCI